MEEKYIKQMNEYGEKGTPFLFIIDFEEKKPIIKPLSEVDENDILYDFQGITNSRSIQNKLSKTDFSFEKFPVDYSVFEKSFNIVKKNLDLGNSFLTNLTFPTPIETDLTLQDVYYNSKAKYRLWLKDEFVCFSPEIFIQIKDGVISSFPMKGTIDASIPNAKETILNDKKETAEHYTIVDLIRNDISQVATDVQVKRFRYIDKIKTNTKTLLQVSSEVSGILYVNYNFNIGTIISKLLPAGSISGAPKKKTLEIIKESEIAERSYYTGICGIFDGKNLDSAVMIRFIDRQKDKLFFKSGGGVTIFSKPKDEYLELLDKIYVTFY